MSGDQLIGVAIIFFITVVTLQLMRGVRYQYIQKFSKPKRWR